MLVAGDFEIRGDDDSSPELSPVIGKRSFARRCQKVCLERNAGSGQSLRGPVRKNATTQSRMNESN